MARATIFGGAYWVERSVASVIDMRRGAVIGATTKPKHYPQVHRAITTTYCGIYGWYSLFFCILQRDGQTKTIR
jgi:hypothetical protein